MTQSEPKGIQTASVGISLKCWPSSPFLKCRVCLICDSWYSLLVLNETDASRLESSQDHSPHTSSLQQGAALLPAGCQSVQQLNCQAGLPLVCPHTLWVNKGRKSLQTLASEKEKTKHS